MRLLPFIVSSASAAAVAAHEAPGAALSQPGTRFVETAGGALAYDDSGGQGPVVLCVPGMGDLRTQYRFLAPRLAAAG